MLFPHPLIMLISGFMLFTRCLPRIFDELANMTATLGSFYWLGFETSGLSPDKKRLAWLGAQRILFVGTCGVISGSDYTGTKSEIRYNAKDFFA